MAGPPAAPTVLSAAILAAAERGDAAQVLNLLEQEGYSSVDTRSQYQSTLLHVAAKHGHVGLARQLLERGADVNALDFGGMRRSPLHWACKGGHVAMVELLLQAGADSTADGRCWSKLVQGQRCGSLIPHDSPTESLHSVCRTNAVRLALTRPAWEPSIHSMWPQRFQATARLLLLASSCGYKGHSSSEGPMAVGVSGLACGSGGDGGGGAEPTGGAHAVRGDSSPVASGDPSGSGGSGGSCQDRGAACSLQLLGHDAVLEILKQAAYPVSCWL